MFQFSLWRVVASIRQCLVCFFSWIIWMLLLFDFPTKKKKKKKKKKCFILFYYLKGRCSGAVESRDPAASSGSSRYSSFRGGNHFLDEDDDDDGVVWPTLSLSPRFQHIPPPPPPIVYGISPSSSPTPPPPNHHSSYKTYKFFIFSISLYRTIFRAGIRYQYQRLSWSNCFPSMSSHGSWWSSGMHFYIIH